MGARKVIEAINEAASQLARSADLASFALSGVSADVQRGAISPRALNVYFVQSQRIIEEARQTLVERVQMMLGFVSTFVAGSNLSASQTHQDAELLAVEALMGGMKQLQLAHARQLRDLAATRSRFALNPKEPNRVMNRVGAQLQATEFFYLTARKALLDFYNQVQIEHLLSIGVTQAQVWHVDSDHDTAGIRFDLVDSQAYANLAETVFHPRANAIVGAIDVSP